MMILLFLNIGFLEMLVVGVAIVVLFGPDKLPKIARDLGSGARKLKDAVEDLKSEVLQDADNPISEIKKEIDGVKKSVQDFNPKEHLDLEKAMEKNASSTPKEDQLSDDYQGPVSR